MESPCQCHVSTAPTTCWPKRLVFTSPAEAFKARYLQAIKPVYLDVRSEADYNLYHLVDSVNVPLKRLATIVPDLLSEPAANTVFITIGNDEAAAVEALEDAGGIAGAERLCWKAESTAGSRCSARTIRR